MIKPTRKNTIAFNLRAIQYLQALAHSEGLAVTPVREGSYLDDFPAHVVLDGVNTRVTARSAEMRADGGKVYDFDIEYFKDITWQVLVCMPESPDHDPVVYRLPQAVWQAHKRIVIAPADPGEFSRYRWSPEARQEKRHQAWIDETLKDEGF